MNEKINKVLENLKKNNMEAYYVDKKEDVLELVKTLVPKGATVAAGGSVTLNETGVMDYIKNGEFNYLDRNKPGLSKEEMNNVCIEALACDVYFSSSNAITEDGDLYNVDGNANRVAALTYGPKSVVIVAGINKIVPDLTAAVIRLKTIAAPKNCLRLGINNYCAIKGHCISIDNGEGERLGAGCMSDTRICCTTVISSKQKFKNRIKVILVGEELGY